MKTLLLILASVLLAAKAWAQPLRVFVSYTDAVNFAPNTVVDLFLTGTDDGGLMVERKTGPGPFADWLQVAPALGMGRQYWMVSNPSLVVTIYPGEGYIFPLTFIDPEPTMAIYRVKKL